MNQADLVGQRLELDHVFHLYDVRQVLEGLCVRLATENAPPETWDEFVELFGAPMDEFVKAGDFDAFIVVYERFRSRIIEWARNPVAARMLCGHRGAIGPVSLDGPAERRKSSEAGNFLSMLVDY